MAITIGNLAAGSLPVIEKRIELLDDTIKIQLLSRKRRREIYPDQTAEDIEQARKPVTELDEALLQNNRALTLATEQLEKLEKLESPLGESDSNSMIQLKNKIPELEAKVKEDNDRRAGLLKAIEIKETERVTSFLQACLTDDTGAQMTAEQATAMVNDTVNELALLEIIKACQQAHGMKTLTMAELEGELPGE